MSLPDNIVGYRTSSGIQRFMETSDWHPECAELWPNHRFYCASNVVSQLAIESTKRELKLAELELQVKALKQGKRVLSEAELRQRREAAKKAVRGKSGKYVKATVVPGGTICYDKIDDFDNWDELVRGWAEEFNPKPPATPLRRFIPERPWYQWFAIRLWDRLEKFFTGKQS